jgi:hypothetical protein
MNFRNILTVLVLCMNMTITFSAIADESVLPEATIDGMQRINGTKMAVVYAKPDVDLSQYKRILLLKPQVAFIKDWQNKQNSILRQRVTVDDMQRIKAELAALFMDVFKEELQSNGGYELVDYAAEDVLIVHPAIFDLNVISPDTPTTRNQRSAIASVGSMFLYMELIDSVTGDKLVKAMDTRMDRTRTRSVQNRVRNERAAREMLGEWAELLRLALDEARAVVK